MKYSLTKGYQRQMLQKFHKPAAMLTIPLLAVTIFAVTTLMRGPAPSPKIGHTHGQTASGSGTVAATWTSKTTADSGNTTVTGSRMQSASSSTTSRPSSVRQTFVSAAETTPAGATATTTTPSLPTTDSPTGTDPTVPDPTMPTDPTTPTDPATPPNDPAPPDSGGGLEVIIPEVPTSRPISYPITD